MNKSPLPTLRLSVETFSITSSTTLETDPITSAICLELNLIIKQPS
jgi:hypothetical protein